YHRHDSIHQREIFADRDGISVTDRVDGADGAPLRSFVHLHPDFEVSLDGRAATARAADGYEVRIEFVGIDAIRIAHGESNPPQGWYCPRFGTRLPAAALELRIDRNDGSEFGYRLRRVPSG